MERNLEQEREKGREKLIIIIRERENETSSPKDIKDICKYIDRYGEGETGERESENKSMR